MSYEEKNDAGKIINYLKAHTKHWCPIVSSKEIKKLIFNRCDELCVSIQEVIISCDLNIKVLMKYWVNENDAVSRPGVRAEQIIKIGKAIGIEIRTVVVVKDKQDYNRNEILNKLKNG